MIKVFTDTGTDLPDSMLKEYDIRVIKNGIAEHTKEGWREFPNNKEMLEEAVKKLKEGVEFRTSAISPGKFKQVFDESTKNGEPAIYVSIPAKGSKNHDIAISAKSELPGRDITVIDAEGGFGLESLVALSLARAIKDGKSKEEAIDSALKTRENAKGLIAIPNISYLYKTGRIPQAKDMTQSVLKLVVIVGFLHVKEQVFSLVGRERNIVSANRKIVSFIEEDLEKNKKEKVRCVIGSILNKDAVADLEAKIKRAGWCVELISAEEYPEGAVIVGPDSLPVGYELL